MLITSFRVRKIEAPTNRLVAKCTITFDGMFAVSDIKAMVRLLSDRGIGVLITDHNVDETLSITDRAYLLFEGKILFQGTPKELADNPVVREKYLGRDFQLKQKTKVSI